MIFRSGFKMLALISALTITSYAEEEKKNVAIEEFDNGITALICSSDLMPDHISFRIIIKKAHLENVDQNVAFFSGLDAFYSEASEIPKEHAFIVHSLISAEQTIYALDTSLNESERIENYCNFCKNRMIAAIDHDRFFDETRCSSIYWKSPASERNFYYSHPLSEEYPLFDPHQVLIIAIGDFELDKAKEFLINHFGDILEESKIDTSLTQLTYSPPAGTFKSLKELRRYWEIYLLKHLYKKRDEMCEGNYRTEKKLLSAAEGGIEIYTTAIDTHAWNQELSVSQLCALSDKIPLGAERRVGNVVDPYYRLPLTESEKAMIAKIITILAENNIFELAFIRSEMMKKGDKIRHVHPLRFMGIIFSDPELRRSMEKISHSYFKWNGFINGFAERADEEASRNNLMRHLPGFAQHVNVDADHLAPFIQKRDWEGFLSYLINPK
jgi:hypothetical protein